MQVDNEKNRRPNVWEADTEKFLDGLAMEDAAAVSSLADPRSNANGFP
jgi:hypothetical protein